MSEERIVKVDVPYYPGIGELHAYGKFHGFSTYADENGSSPVAIVELDDGKVITPDPTHVKFINK